LTTLRLQVNEGEPPAPDSSPAPSAPGGRSCCSRLHRSSLVRPRRGRPIPLPLEQPGPEENYAFPSDSALHAMIVRARTAIDTRDLPAGQVSHE